MEHKNCKFKFDKKDSSVVLFKLNIGLIRTDRHRLSATAAAAAVVIGEIGGRQPKLTFQFQSFSLSPFR